MADIELKDYLRTNYKEEMPDWLENLNQESDIPWNNFFASRNVFYPGAGTDGHAVEVFSGSHSAHCFVYVDYMIKKKDLSEALAQHPFKGYSIIYNKDVSEKDFFEIFKNSQSFVDQEDLMKIQEKRIELLKDFIPYAKFLVFERNAGYGDDFGTKRFALLYLGTDAIPVFNDVYAARKGNLFAMLLEDYGFGGQYEKFNSEGLLHRIAKKADVLPEFILTYNSPWDELTSVEGVKGSCGGMHNYCRNLQKRS